MVVSIKTKPLTLAIRLPVAKNKIDPQNHEMIVFAQRERREATRKKTHTEEDEKKQQSDDYDELSSLFL